MNTNVLTMSSDTAIGGYVTPSSSRRANHPCVEKAEVCIVLLGALR